MMAKENQPTYVNPEHELVEPDTTPVQNDKESVRKKRKLLLIAVAVVVLIALIVTLSIVLTRDKNESLETESETEEYVAPAQLPNSELTSNWKYQLLNGEVDAAWLLNPATPQGKAFEMVFGMDSTDSHEVRQRFALLTIYYATDGPENWTQKDGWSEPLTTDVCKWYGVGAPRVGVCRMGGSTRGTVRALELANNNLVGSLPEEICMLEELQTLDLSGNDIYGKLPSCLEGISVIGFGV